MIKVRGGNFNSAPRYSRPLSCAALVLLGACASGCASGATSHPRASGADPSSAAVFVTVTVEDEVRAHLAALWEAHYGGPTPALGAAEYAGCLPFRWRESGLLDAGRPVGVRRHVTGYRAVRVDSAGPAFVYVTERCGAGEIPAHSHPPSTCYGKDVCAAGGIAGHACRPSGSDVRFLLANGYLLGAVACGPRELVFYAPASAPDGTTVVRR